MINGKALLRQMKRDYKYLGYDLYAYNDDGDTRYFLRTNEWAIDVAARNLPRKVLALVVEHTGELPDKGAVNVGKNGIQTEILGMEDVEQITRRKGVHISKAPIMYREYELWQAPKDLNVAALRPDIRAIVNIENARQTLYDDNTVFWTDGDTTIAITCERDMPQGEARLALRNIRWI